MSKRNNLKVVIVERPSSLGGGSHFAVYPEGEPQTTRTLLATGYPWYKMQDGHVTHEVQGYAWGCTANVHRYGIPHVTVSRDNAVPTPEQAQAWARWYFEECEQ